MNLKAGPLSMIYDRGFIRHIRYHDVQLIDMIYFNIRPVDWDTVSMSIIKENLLRKNKSFSVSYEAISEISEIKVHWKVKITGSAKGLLKFKIAGKALSTFKKNRIGFCVLHPIKENVDRHFIVEHTNGKKSNHYFPRFISPQVICSDIRSIIWNFGENVIASVTCMGDAFEMEDHRNWADYSFKTYCTPLCHPYPVEVRKDEEIKQTVMVSLQNGQHKIERETTAVNILIGRGKFKIPIIGVKRSTHPEKLNRKTLQELKKISFSHYRTDVYPGLTNWKTDLLLAAGEAKAINACLEIFLFLSAEFKNEIEEFLKMGIGEKELRQITILPRNESVAIHLLLEIAVLILRKRYPSVPLGSGTIGHFAELNRSDLKPFFIDFVTYSGNPQVHATDDQTIIENLPALSETIISAKQKFPFQKIHISPLTFINPGQDKSIREFKVQIDPRLKTSFGVGWVLGSLQNIILSGADSVTYLETLGGNGLFEIGNDGKSKKNPVVMIFEEVLQSKYILSVSIDQPAVVSCLVFKKANKTLYVLANHTSLRQKIFIRNASTNKIITKRTLSPYQVRFQYH